MNIKGSQIHLIDGEIVYDTTNLKDSDRNKRKKYWAQVYVVFSPKVGDTKGIVSGSKLYLTGTYRTQTKLDLVSFCKMLHETISKDISFKVPFGIVATVERGQR